MFHGGRSRARRPASATARCCAIEKLEERDREGTVYRGRVIKVIDHAKTRVLGIFRALPGGGGRLIPVDKKQAGRELNIAKADTGGAEDGDLVSVDLVRSRGFGLASGKVKERLGSLASRKGGQPDRDPCPRNSASLLARRVARGRGGKARNAEGPRGLARRCRWSRSIRPTPRTMTTRFMPSPIPIRTTRAATSSMSRSPTSPSMCGRARRSTATR